jgi:HlyD family secretion protein
MKRKKIIIARIVVLSLLAGAAAAWWFDVPAKLGWVQRDQDQLTLYGNVDIRQVQLGFRVSGRIAEMLVDEGDTVRAGQTLARLDPSTYKDSVREATAQTASQRATLEKLVAGPRPAEIEQARAARQERMADLEFAQQAYDRARQLRVGVVISQAQLDQATATRNADAARAASAREALRLLEEGSRAEDIESARANLQAAEAALASAQTALRDAQLLAPSDGVVLSRVRESGAITAPSDIVYVFSLTNPVWVRTYVPEPMLGKIYPGMQVEVLTDSDPGRAYRGRIGFISPVAEFTPKSVETPELRTDLVYRLRVVVDEADRGLRQGMPVTVRVPLQRREDGGT